MRNEEFDFPIEDPYDAPFNSADYYEEEYDTGERTDEDLNFDVFVPKGAE